MHSKKKQRKQENFSENEREVIVHHSKKQTQPLSHPIPKFWPTKLLVVQKELRESTKPAGRQLAS